MFNLRKLWPQFQHVQWGFPSTSRQLCSFISFLGHSWFTVLCSSLLYSRVNRPHVTGNPLQCSRLENPRDGGAWWAAVYGVAQSRTWWKRLSSSSNIHIILSPMVFLPRSLSHKKEQDHAIFRVVDKPRDCHPEWHYSGGEKQISLLMHVCTIWKNDAGELIFKQLCSDPLCWEVPWEVLASPVLLIHGLQIGPPSFVSRHQLQIQVVTCVSNWPATDQRLLQLPP